MSKKKTLTEKIFDNIKKLRKESKDISEKFEELKKKIEKKKNK